MKRRMDDDGEYPTARQDGAFQANTSKRMRHYERNPVERRVHEPLRASRDPSNASVKRQRQETAAFASSTGNKHQHRATPQVRLLVHEKETDPRRLEQRQKQIDYGKNTLGYDRYCATVPRERRRPRVHPMTPDKTAKVSKKAFDRLIRNWRQALHRFDPPELQQASQQINAPRSCDATNNQQPNLTKNKYDAQQIMSSTESNQDFSDDAAELNPSNANHLDDLGNAQKDEAKPIEAAAPVPSIFEDFVEDDEFLQVDVDVDDDDDDDLL